MRSLSDFIKIPITSPKIDIDDSGRGHYKQVLLKTMTTAARLVILDRPAGGGRLRPDLDRGPRPRRGRWRRRRGNGLPARRSETIYIKLHLFWETLWRSPWSRRLRTLSPWPTLHEPVSGHYCDIVVLSLYRGFIVISWFYRDIVVL